MDTEPRVRPSRRVADDLYASLVSMIEREFAPGTRLPPEVSVAERFGVSRPTLRESLARLRVDGLIVSRRGSGSYVADRNAAKAPSVFGAINSLQQIKNCYEFRAGFECEAAALAASLRDDAQLESIKRALAGLEEHLEDREAGPDLDFDFHAAIARASGNPWFGDALLAIKIQMQTVINIGRQLSLTEPVSHLTAVQNEHAAIFDAIALRDSVAAREAMREHLVRGSSRIFRGQSVSS